MLKKVTLAAGIAALVIAALFAVQATASSTTLTIHKPEAPVPTNAAGKVGRSDAVFVPTLVFSSDQTAVAQPAMAAVTALDHPVAQLEKVPAGVQSVYVTHYPQAPEPTNGVTFKILTSIKQTINGKAVYITTARPNGVAKQRPLALGNNTVTLRNGTTAYTITNGPNDTPNAVTWAQDDLIITVAGGLPINQLQDLAAQVVLK